MIPALIPEVYLIKCPLRKNTDPGKIISKKMLTCNIVLFITTIFRTISHVLTCTWWGLLQVVGVACTTENSLFWCIKLRHCTLFIACCFISSMGWWCSGIYPDFLCRRSVVRFPDPSILEECAKGICLCNLLRSTQPNDRETVIEG